MADASDCRVSRVRKKIGPKVGPGDTLWLGRTTRQEVCLNDRNDAIVLPFQLVSMVLEAARGVRDHQISYWDAQLWATALRHGATVVLSEDFSDGQTIEGVTFRDPFASGFDLKRLASTA